ncbi:MAG: HAMP domain-containing sensor histidine kinase [Rubrivivax sp.]
MTRTVDTPVSGGEPANADEPEEDWAGAIAAWPPSSSNQEKSGPAQGRLLTFRDRRLEYAYLQFEYERSKKVIVIGLTIAAIVSIGFLWLDPLIMPPEHLGVVSSTRLCVVVPVALIALMGSIIIKDARVWIPLASLLVLIDGLWPSSLILMTDVSLYQASATGIWNFTVVAFFLGGLPLWVSTSVCLAFGAVFTACSLAIHVSTEQFTMFANTFAMGFLFSAFATYRYERATRLQFVAQGMSQILAARRLAVEADRRKWLEVIAAFLRHELNNAMTAISSSIDMAERTAERAKLAKFLSRARRSTLFMRRLLAQVADATSLESALVKRNFERVDLSALLRDRLLDFQDDHGLAGFAVEAALDEGVQVLGNADALTQMLDKLLNNAREHAAPGHSVHAELRHDGTTCRLVLADQGDPLPDDVELLFRPFVSSKVKRTGGANLGLGLFVARTIASHHGGTLRAEPLDGGRTGARFIVSLPLATG